MYLQECIAQPLALFFISLRFIFSSLSFSLLINKNASFAPFFSFALSREERRASNFFSKRCVHVVVIFTGISLPLSLPLFLSLFLPLLACEEVNYEPCTLINSFFEIFSSIKNWATFLRWSPWSWMISPSSESSTIVPLQLNFFLHSFKMIFLLILGLIPCNVVKDFLPFLCCVRM